MTLPRCTFCTSTENPKRIHDHLSKVIAAEKNGYVPMFKHYKLVTK